MQEKQAFLKIKESVSLPSNGREKHPHVNVQYIKCFKRWNMLSSTKAIKRSSFFLPREIRQGVREDVTFKLNERFHQEEKKKVLHSMWLKNI